MALTTCEECGDRVSTEAEKCPHCGFSRRSVASGSSPAPSSGVERLMLYQAHQKSAGVAYLLWFFLGWAGLHRFYLGRSGSGAAMLLLTLVSIPLMFVGIGVLTGSIVAIWWFVDLFLIPGAVREHNVEIAQTMAA